MNVDAADAQPAPTVPALDLEKLVFALGNFSRWRMLGELSDGDTRSIRELAEVGGCSYDAAIKHLQLLRETGLVMQGRGSLYRLTPHFLPKPGERLVDFGHCLLRFKP